MDSVKSLVATVNVVLKVNNQHKVRPISIIPSPMLGEGVDSKESLVEDCIQSCALCGKPFPNRDVIMASCGCFYHLWCIVIEN